MTSPSLVRFVTRLFMAWEIILFLCIVHFSSGTVFLWIFILNFGGGTLNKNIHTYIFGTEKFCLHGKRDLVKYICLSRAPSKISQVKNGEIFPLINCFFCIFYKQINTKSYLILQLGKFHKIVRLFMWLGMFKKIYVTSIYVKLWLYELELPRGRNLYLEVLDIEFTDDD